MQETDDSGPQSHACPACQTWMGAAAGYCLWCGEPTAWLAGQSGVRAILAGQAHRLHLLEVRVHDGSLPDLLRRAVNEPLEHVGRDGEPWRFSLAGNDHELLVEHRGRTTRLRLPMREEMVDGLAISARSLLVAHVVGPPPRIAGHCSEPTALGHGGKTTLGSGTQSEYSHVSVPDRTLAMRHCLIVPDPAQDQWIVDLGTTAGTFVNGQPIVSARLREGDDIRLGGFAWRYDATNRFLVPLEPVEGAAVRLRHVAVLQRLDPLDLDVPAGQFVAIVGPSNAGKSTLLKAMLAGPGTRYQGSVEIGDFNAETQTVQFRAELGYVSQEAALHHDLPVLEAIRFSALVRGKQGTTPAIKEWLRELEVNTETWDRPVSSLSGGELKRVRVAAELVGRPRCFLLDEPASGLDAQREKKLMRLLRRLSNQGCTVLIVTHNLAQLHWVDRVLVLRLGQIAFDGTPAQFQRSCPGPAYDFEKAQFPAPAIDKPISSGNVTEIGPGRKRRLVAGRLNGNLLEARHLIQREAMRLLRSWWARLVVPLFVLPLVFATLLDWSVQPFERELLGFLAVVSCIWMGGSLSLTAIVDEHEVINYERLLFLHFSPYIAAKTVTGWAMGFFQTAVFLAILQSLRMVRRGDAALLGSVPWCLLCLAMVSCAAAGLGLAVSALAKWIGSKELAHFLFPLLMMGQMVLSVQVFNPEAEGVGAIAKYQNFSWQHSQEGGRTLAAVGSYLTLSRYGDVALRTFAYREKDFRAFATEQGWFWWSVAILLAAMMALPIIAGLILLWGERLPFDSVCKKWWIVRQRLKTIFSEFRRARNSD